MRARRAPQRSLFDAGYPDHDMGQALAVMSRLLDEHPEFLEWIAADVGRGVVSSVGRRGLPCEVILRCGILKHLWQSDYRELEFALVDSASARRFTRVDPLRSPKRSALQRCIGAVRGEVWERINRVLLGRACAEGGRLGVTGIPTTLVDGSKVRGSHPVEVFEGLVETVGTRQ